MGYWQSVRSRWLDIGQVLFCVFMDRDGVEVQKLAKKRTRSISEQGWSIKPLLYGFRGNFPFGTQRIAPRGQDSEVLPTQVVNHCAGSVHLVRSLS